MLTKYNPKLTTSLPMTITNESCILLTEDNYSSYTTADNIGKYWFVYPFPFAQGKTYPKLIVLNNIAIFDEDGKEMMGSSAHAGFNTESSDLDYCIGFITYIHKTTAWQVTKSNVSTLLWFKNIKGEIFQPYRFILVGRYIF